MPVQELIRRGETVTGLSAFPYMSPEYKDSKKDQFIFKPWDKKSLGPNKLA
jgi:hypothetical protein